MYARNQPVVFNKAACFQAGCAVDEPIKFAVSHWQPQLRPVSWYTRFRLAISVFYVCSTTLVLIRPVFVQDPLECLLLGTVCTNMLLCCLSSFLHAVYVVASTRTGNRGIRVAHYFVYFFNVANFDLFYSYLFSFLLYSYALVNERSSMWMNFWGTNLTNLSILHGIFGVVVTVDFLLVGYSHVGMHFLLALPVHFLFLGICAALPNCEFEVVESCAVKPAAAVVFHLVLWGVSVGKRKIGEGPTDAQDAQDARGFSDSVR